MITHLHTAADHKLIKIAANLSFVNSSRKQSTSVTVYNLQRFSKVQTRREPRGHQNNVQMKKLIGTQEEE